MVGMAQRILSTDESHRGTILQTNASTATNAEIIINDVIIVGILINRPAGLRAQFKFTLIPYRIRDGACNKIQPIVIHLYNVQQ